jgi:sRNA-binding regulator protein Hfq
MSFILSKKIFFLFFIVSFSQLFADIVYLKNGKKIEGKIVNQSRTQIQIDVNGKLELIDKQNINKIEFENLEERKKQEELKRKQEIKPPNTESVYLKTVVLPGWGEYSINNYYRSAIWGGLFWISLGSNYFRDK